MQLRKRVTEFLKTHPEQKFTTRQIAEWFRETYPDDCKQKMQTTTRKTKSALITQLRAEIGTVLLRAEPRFQSTDDDPVEWYFSETISEKESPATKPPSTTNEVDEQAETQPVLTEHDLYPLLWEYLIDKLSVYSKRIDDRKAKNSEGPKGNHWLYPDLVGLEGLSYDWDDAIIKCAKEQGEKRARLWSFEVKRTLSRSNVREAFFQTVSNSSWANFGYLVAGQINGQDTMQELQILASLHGIGVIRLDWEYPKQKSELLIPAREKSEVDWTNANRLAEKSGDFGKFIDLVTVFQTHNRIDPKQWHPSTWQDD